MNSLKSSIISFQSSSGEMVFSAANLTLGLSASHTRSFIAIFSHRLLRGPLEIRVESNNYKLNTNEVTLFDGTFDHGYTVISDAEFLVIHIPKDIRIIEALLKPRDL
ncbi:MAG: hypothetical protein IIB56_05190 [Planctomycetes bacterium]|nr:hypothetical protein [Planctomycetota bacterium]